MPKSQTDEQPKDKTNTDVPQPTPPKPAIREMERKPPAGDPNPKQPPEAV
jgi:hypothetical protein